MIDINKICDFNNDFENPDEVLSLSVDAKEYLMSFTWCQAIVNGWVVHEWGFMLGIFYFEIKPLENSAADNFVWIIVGDVPPAYIDIESAKNKFEALSLYIFLMEEWCNNIIAGKSVDDCFPVNVEPSKKHAKMLISRLEIIKSDFLMELKESDEINLDFKG